MRIERENGILILKPAGAVCEYRPDSYQELIMLTLEVIEANAKQELLVMADLSEVTFMNSSGLAQLVHMYISTRSRRGRFCLYGVSKRVMALLKITCTDRLFQLYATKQEALAAFASPQTD